MTRATAAAICLLAALTRPAISQDGGGTGGDTSTRLPPCPVLGKEILEDQDCYCSKEARRAGGNLHGSGPYLWYSNVCLAAMHAGVTGPDGGAVRIEIRPPQPGYVGTLANGTFSADYGSSDENSFDVLPIGE